MSIFYLIVFGQGLKLGPINFLDELALAIGLIREKKLPKLKFKFNIAFYFGLYFFIINILGFFIFYELNAIRLSIIGLLLMFTSSYKIDFFSKKSILAFWIYPIVIILICVFEILNGILFWHQEWLWSGSAYSALGIVVSAIFASIFYNNSPLLSLLHIIISIVAAIITDSRTSLIFLLGLLFIWILEKINKTFKTTKKLFVGFILLTIIIVFFIYTKELYIYQLSGVNDTINAIFGNSYRPSDQDRFNQMAVIGDYLSQANVFNIIFGNGGESYKFILVDFMGADANAIRRVVRPTGFPGFIVMGGLLFTTGLYLKIIINILKPFFSRKFYFKLMFTNMKLSYLHIVLFIFPFITNVLDSVLYFVIILYANDIQKISRSLTV